ncbi:hypothetical protein [Gemmata sp.]|uniref:hypothetical protein n=1 Tax=Gemmata sp. TaxID=1914242 RepID=UPI003F72E1B8
MAGEAVGVALGAEVGIVPVPFMSGIGSNRAATLIARSSSYTERVGASGLLLFVKGRFGPRRTLTPLTGHWLPGTPRQIHRPANGTAGLRAVLRRWGRRRPRPTDNANPSPPFQGCISLSCFTGMQETGSPERVAAAGLLIAFRRAASLPDPIGLTHLGGKNRDRIRTVAKLVHTLCDGQVKTVFFLGSVSLGKLLGIPQCAAHRAVAALEEQGVIVRVRTGKRIRDPTDRSRWLNIASEFTYQGLPS